VPDETWIEWSPRHALHVKGRYTPRVYDPVLLTYDEQKVEAECEMCGETWEGRCDSGRVREKITKFAAMHLHTHTDPLTVK